LRGSTLQDLSVHIAILFAIGVTVLVFAAWRFKRSLA